MLSKKTTEIEPTEAIREEKKFMYHIIINKLSSISIRR